MSGKGSGRRPTNEEQYMNNWDTIFGKRVKDVEQLKLFEEQEEEHELREKASEPNR